MSDTGVMRRPTGRTALDPVTDQEAQVFEDVFTSKAKIQTRNLISRVHEAGDRSVTTVRVELHLPITAPAVRTGDIWEHTTVGPLSDSQLVGRKFRVVAPAAKTFATARRFEVEEFVS
jgi:hypothetical protein